ncbi:MAG TPA: MDR family MFS transporter [Alphaproteobacteria bacterium]|nr:MDR family MFS transporter [Alphaproteobacteria bacterium]
MSEPGSRPSETRPRDAAAGTFTHREILVILSGIMLGMLLAGLDQTIVATALPTIARELQGIEHMSWVVSAYLLTSTASTPIYGKLSDLYGRKVMLQVALGIFLVASILCALAGTMTQLILFRALQGLGGGGLISMAHATIADVISPRDRGRYQGYFSAVFAATSVGGPVLGGFFADHLTWRWVFWINPPIGVAAILISNHAMRKLVARRVAGEIDYWGASLLVTAVTLLLLVTTWGGVTLPWSSPQILGLTLLGLAFTAAFLLRERVARDPILPLRLFLNRVFSVASIVSFLTSMAMFGGIVYLPLFLQLVAGDTASESGFLLIPFTGTTVVGAYIAGQLVSRTGRYKLYPCLGLVFATIAFVLLAFTGAATSEAVSAAYMALLGVGIGMVLPVMVVSIQNAVELRDLGTATGALNFFRSMGGSFGVALLGSVLLAQLSDRIAAVPGHEQLGPHPSLDLLHGQTGGIAAIAATTRALLVGVVQHSFTIVFLCAAAIALAGFAICVFLKEIPLRTTPALSAPTE